MLPQYVPEISSVCLNAYSVEITLQFYYWLLVEGPGDTGASSRIVMLFLTFN